MESSSFAASVAAKWKRICNVRCNFNPDPDSRIGGTMLAVTMTEPREVDGRLCIKCVGAGWVPAGRVRSV